MTRATKKPSHRPVGAAIGKVSRSRGGIVIVEYATGIIDNGAPEFFVTHLCRVEKLGPGTVRISWGCQQEDGTILVMYKAILDMQTWLAQQKPIDEARTIISRLPPDGDGRRQGAH